MKSICDAENYISNVVYGFNDYYKLSYLEPNKHSRILDALSVLRREKIIEADEYHKIRIISKHYLNNFYKIKELIRNEPRVHAQKFIGRKKIRSFIFNRDNNICLCCGSSDNLSIDHIIPVSKYGENNLMNLQTLCKSCNSRKSNKYIDYR